MKQMKQISKLKLNELESYFNLTSRMIDTIATSIRMNNNQIPKFNDEFKRLSLIMDKLKNEINKRLNELE